VEVIRHIASHPRRFRAPAVTLGNFDGVHLGHQTILRAAVADAHGRGDDAVVITFEPHPIAVLRPEAAPPVLTSLPDRLRLLAASDVDVVVLQRFTPAFAARTAEEFVADLIVARLHAQKVVVGHSVSFGRGRGGNADVLTTLGGRHGFTVEVVGPVKVGPHLVSSSGVRRAIGEGDVRLAAELLGRPHRVGGRVVRGQRRGVTIGFPTANVRVHGAMLPADGVYAVTMTVAGAERPGVANVGRNPTFGPDAPRTLEVHLFDFDGDLYGARAVVGFVERLRGEIRFPSVDALVAQIGRDAEQARALLARR
jgi:riboflavin kinase/FMN adenylyltransferase